MCFGSRPVPAACFEPNLRIPLDLRHDLGVYDLFFLFVSPEKAPLEALGDARVLLLACGVSEDVSGKICPYTRPPYRSLTGEPPIL